MAWTAPATATTGQVVTAAFWNAQVRDNFLETSPATVTTAGDLTYANGANNLVRLGIGSAGTRLVSTGSAPAWRSTAQSVGDASYISITGFSPTTGTDFDSGSGAGTDVAVTITTGTIALVHFGVRAAELDATGGSLTISYRVSGATTIAASNVYNMRMEQDVADMGRSFSRSHLQTALNAGSNTFTLQRAVGSAAHVHLIEYPYIIVEAL